MTGVGIHLHAILIVEHGGEGVVYVAAVVGTGLASSHGGAPRRVTVLQGPGADVEVVHVLLHVEIARQPGEVVPVAHLVLHLGGLAAQHFGQLLPGAVPYAAAVIIGLKADDVADLAAVNLPHRFLEAVEVAQAETGNHRESLALGFLA